MLALSHFLILMNGFEWRKGEKSDGQVLAFGVDGFDRYGIHFL